MVNLEFRPFFQSKEERTEKRREQVRRAQKTFRERRDQYLKLLERQLGKFQSDNASLTSDVERLRTEVSVLRLRLNSCEDNLRMYRPVTPECEWRDRALESTDVLMPQPTPLPDKGHDFSFVRLDSPDGKPHQLVLSPSSLGSSPEIFTNFSTPNLQRRGTTKQKRLDKSLPKQPPSRDISQPQYVAHLDTVVVAMEFVLKLEAPCLPHIHDPAQEPTDTDNETPQGHMHLVSATLLSCIHSHSSPHAAHAYKPTPGRSPALLPTPPHSGTNEASPHFSALSWPSPPASSSQQPHSFVAPRSIVASLLARSEALPKANVEITPVQAWHQLAGHAAFGRLSVAALEVLGERLLLHIKCYGFGGVIKQEFLDGLLRQL